MVSRWGFGGNRSWSVCSNCHDVRMEVQGKVSKHIRAATIRRRKGTTTTTTTMKITLLRDNCWTQLGGAVFEVKSERERERE